MVESEIESYPFREVFAHVTVFDLVWIENKHIVQREREREREIAHIVDFSVQLRATKGQLPHQNSDRWSRNPLNGES